MTSVLMVLTSHEELGSTGNSTGWYLSEAAHPWKVFSDNGDQLTFVSPEGGRSKMDGADLDDPIQAGFLEEYGDEGPDTVTPDSIDPALFDVIFYVGGHGTMWDFPDDENLASLASKIYDGGGIVGAVCHGPAGLLNIELSDGKRLIDGKNVAGFTNSEEAANDLTDVVPFLLEDELKAKGAFHHAGDDFEAQVVTDGRLVTGQSPSSATGVAEEIVELLAAT